MTPEEKNCPACLSGTGEHTHSFKTLAEIFGEEDDSVTDPSMSLMEILSREDAEHG